MAIIQTIRTKAGILMAIVIGGALVLFILGDFLKPGSLMQNKSRNTLAEINGNKISYPEYQKIVTGIEAVLKTQYQTNSLNQEMTERAKNQAWQDILQYYVLEQEYDKLGLTVSDAEFLDLIQGRNPHPLLTQLFPNPQTGALDRLKLNAFLSGLDEMPEDRKMIWKFYEDIISKEKRNAKYNTLLRKGLFVNKVEASRRMEEMSTSVDFSFIQKQYSAISDSSIEISEAELKAYYKEHKEEYKQEETRDIKYVAFKITPFESDFEDALAWISDARSELEEIQDVEQYINFNSDERFDAINYKKGELSDTLDDFMFSAREGDVYGPYFEDNAYKLAKLAKINYIPDSVHVSHILLSVNQNNFQQMQLLADSLKNLAISGADFSALAKDHSSDVTSFEGDLGWIHEGHNGRPFSDSCFYAEKGDVKITYSDNGLHLVKITDQSKPVKKVQVGILSRVVVASDKTDHFYYTKAVEFASSNNTLEKFEKATQSNSPVAVPVYNLNPMDQNVRGIENSRNIVHWAFSAEEGQMRKDINSYDGNYIVVIVTKAKHKGYSPFEDVSESIELDLKKLKKAELLTEEINTVLEESSSIDELADKLDVSVKSAKDIRFNSYSIADIGAEPKLIAAAANAETELLSEPIAGENGVYVLFVDNKKATQNNGATLDQAKGYVQSDYGARVNRSSYAILQDLADIEDNRYKFY